MNQLKIILIISVVLVSGLFINEAFAVPTNVWEYREQSQIIGFPTIATWTVNPPLEMDSAFAGISHSYTFMTFNKTDVINRDLNFTWSGIDNGVAQRYRMAVYDGSYVASSFVDFPPDVFSGQGFILKGGGIQHFIDRASSFPSVTIDSFNMTLPTSIMPQVTVFVYIRDTSSIGSSTTEITEIKVSDFGLWEFDSSTIILPAVSGTDQDSGVILANLTDLSIPPIVDVTPPVITLIGANPQSVKINTAFVELGATCLDDTNNDGFTDMDISGSLVIDSSVIVTSVAGGNTEFYDCQDIAGNDAIQVERLVVTKRETSGTKFDGGAVGGQQSITDISDVQPLTAPAPEPITVDRAFDLFATLNQLFAPTEPVTEIAPSQPPIFDTTPTPEPVPEITIVQESFFDAISSFFSSLFG